MNKFYVYIHICPNNKRYVGITRQNPKKRWSNGNGYKKNAHFTRAIDKYGWDNISHQVIEVDTESEMFYLEKYLIAFYNSNNPEFGYNNSLGGERGNNKGLNSNCSDYWKQYRQDHKEEREQYKKEWRKNNKEKIKMMNKRYYELHKEECNNRMKEYRKNVNTVDKYEKERKR